MRKTAEYDIILVTPLESSGAQGYFHIGLLQLATFLIKEGYNVCFFDRNAMVYGRGITVEETDHALLEIILSSGAKFVGFTFYTSYFSDIYHTSHLIKEG